MAYRNQHYVPQAYLKAWTDSNDKLYVLNKNKSIHKHSKTDSILYSPNLYTRTVRDELILTPEDIESIFGKLKDYIIKINGVIIDDINEYANQYAFFDKWEIFNKDETLARKKQIKHEIDTVRITTTEHRWDQIENRWNELKEKIEKFIFEKKETLSSNDLNQLHNFIVAQKWRTPKSIQYYRDMISEEIERNEVQFVEQYGEISEEAIDQFALAYFKKKLMGYQDKDEKSHIIKEIELAGQYTIVFYVTESENYFYTSDNPVFTLIDAEFHNSMFNGMYFPVTPRILCAICKGDPNEIIVGTMGIELLEEFNELIIKNSQNYFISLLEIEQNNM
ncbi:DUF4238 domain-containing protein [Saccharibacillus kuerlensis]|uniref:DUF4238 domain-containing protein n=1 Tax=Saccharibacillus kuerlensis TaxID=459527 RepID=A0ABQ2KT63_9BACL|nr:DUF4238 domain-containing protein [Saccharibacillus kuerlensis]GGN91498.1 hypothetical protein GCM10010969_03240 [Saccharibacillus kuerlensis]